MFPCKQNREKGIIVVTIIIKPQTHKIHKLDWGGFGNAVSYQRCRLFWTFCTDRAEQEPKQTSPTAVTRLGPPGKTARPAPAARSRILSGRVGHPAKSAGEAEGFWWHPVRSTCITGPISEWTFINIYKSVTGTWNVFGWNNPTLQDNVFTEYPGPGWLQQAMIMVLSVSLGKRQLWD